MKNRTKQAQHGKGWALHPRETDQEASTRCGAQVARGCFTRICKARRFFAKPKPLCPVPGARKPVLTPAASPGHPVEGSPFLGLPRKPPAPRAPAEQEDGVDRGMSYSCPFPSSRQPAAPPQPPNSQKPSPGGRPTRAITSAIPCCLRRTVPLPQAACCAPPAPFRVDFTVKSRSQGPSSWSA